MIEVTDLTKYYGKRLALDKVSFTIPAGQVVGLLGLNGAGKSTAMNILTGCLASSSGMVRINGIDMAEESERAKRGIGYLPETPPLYADMKAGEYLDFMYSIKKAHERIAPDGNRKEKERLKKQHLAIICDRTGIAETRNRLIKNLSKGYKQRGGLASALVGDPDLLVLDEPSAGLDPAQIIEIRKLIAGLGKSAAIIFSSHILSEVQALCNRVMVLHRGRIAADMGREELNEGGSLEKIFIDLVKGGEA